MLVIHAETPEQTRAEILEFLRYSCVQTGPHPILHKTKRAIRDAEQRESALKTAIRLLEVAKIEAAPHREF